VTWIYDGDTVSIEVGGVESDVRLIGINATEEGECFHREATDHLIDVLKGETVGVEESGTDRFGRTLASLWLEDSLVNLDLVEEGLAIATTPGDGETYGRLLLAAEDRAVSRGTGLWAEDACGASGPVPDVQVDVPGSRFDPPGRDEEALDQEWVAFVSPEPVDLGGWTVRDESSAHRCLLPTGTNLIPGQSLAVSSADPCWDPGGSPVWNNDGDMVFLLDPSDRVVARARYHD
jgi:endonuclease YncB( thermonuclease family)